MEIQERNRVDYNQLIDEDHLDNLARPLTYSPTLSTRSNRLLKRSNGRSNIKYTNLPPSGWIGFFKDGFTTVINARWFWIILMFCTLYCGLWLLFGFLWWGLNETYENLRNYTCVEEVSDFPSAFLFSVETELTIGYGHRFITTDCGLGVFLLVVQCLIGLLLDSFLIGLVFSKLTRPRNRRKTILFSDCAVINEKNGKRYFEFRIADLRRSQLVEAHVRVQLYWYKGNERTKDCTLEQFDLDVGYDTGKDRIVLVTPVVVSHLITEDSPLYNITEDNILQQDLEILIVLEAIVESTGLTVQALWSYTEREILMGFYFRPMIYRHGFNCGWEIDYQLMNDVVSCDQ